MAGNLRLGNKKTITSVENKRTSKWMNELESLGIKIESSYYNRNWESLDIVVEGIEYEDSTRFTPTEWFEIYTNGNKEKLK